MRDMDNMNELTSIDEQKKKRKLDIQGVPLYTMCAGKDGLNFSNPYYPVKDYSLKFPSL